MVRRFGAVAAVVMLGALAGPAMAQVQGAGCPIDSGATAWMLTSTALVLLMVPGLAMFYGGLVRTKNVLGTMMHSFAAMAIIGVIWAAVGYTLSFGPNILHGFCGWNAKMLFLGQDSNAFAINNGTACIPELVFAMFQGKFAIITPALIAGAFAERVRFRGYCVFIALWGVIVYCPLAHWVWASDGFLQKMGAQDYAGGTVVHISAGVSALICAIYLGARRGYPRSAMHPNNLVMTMMGAGLLWVGWFGFNAGSSLSSNFDTARALTVTQAAAATAALSWMIIEAIHHHKATSLGLCSGILAGLVAITPAAGVVSVAGAMALGALASLICYFTVIAKTHLGYDDSLDVFGIHGVAGIFGAIGLSFFLRHESAVDLANHFGPNWNVWRQFVVQVTAVAVACAYASVMTIVLVVLVDNALGFRLDPTLETAGMDHSLHGEHGYGLLNLQ